MGTRNKHDLRWPDKKYTTSNDGQTTIDSLEPAVTVGEALGDLPTLKIPKRGAKLTDTLLAYTKQAILSKYQESMRSESSNVHNHITNTISSAEFNCHVNSVFCV